MTKSISEEFKAAGIKQIWPPSRLCKRHLDGKKVLWAVMFVESGEYLKEIGDNQTLRAVKYNNMFAVHWYDLGVKDLDKLEGILAKILAAK